MTTKTLTRTRYLSIVLAIMITSCAFQRPLTNTLLGINNLTNFFNKEYSYNPPYPVSHGLIRQRKVKSISIYRYSTAYQKYLPEDSIIFDKSGKAVMDFKPNTSNEFSLDYFFYDHNGNRYLDINIGSNKYDTYTLRTFDEWNRANKKITYNATRKEYERIFVTSIIPISDSELNIKYAFYDSDLKYGKILPFETRDITVKMLNDSVAEANTMRIVQHDTSYNSSFTDLYKLKNNVLIPINRKSVIDSNEHSLKRAYNFYKSAENEISNTFPKNQLVIKTLRIKIDSLPILAWQRYRTNLKEFAERNKIIETGLNTDSIGVAEGLAIKDFSPQLWYTVSRDSGTINGLNDQCYIVGYNTPLKDESDFNKRCLAIYERINGKYMLRKQTFFALEDFVDDESDLLFDGYNETNFSLAIENGDIVVMYEYMRGEASYTFSYENKKWILVYYQSSHRTCCQAEFYSYSYRTKTYSYSISSTGEHTAGDTAVTIIQERPIMYMDSMNIRKFDYNETGLIAK
jgi:hypothetical protein